ncbi:MAG: glutathione S-transferase [Betaproteobacteria bacterium]|nr:glutathione S-transferase [Betaproteobacteria bacterium]PWB63457.1 MAG: glutathione S-transferase [Betaproteobacteria bacterium]
MSAGALRIWGRISSVNVQKVVWTADELGIAYERRDAGGAFGIVATPEYKRMNPNSLVPVIEEDGFVLWESNAIVRYLAAKHAPGTLWPDDLRRRADVDRWMDWQATTFTPAMRDAFWQLVRVPAEKRDAAAIEASRSASEKAAAVLEGHLAGRQFVSGDAFSPADIVLGCAAHRWLNLPLAREPRPHMERWYASLKARPGAAQVLSTPVT